MLLSPRKNGLTSLFKEVGVFKVGKPEDVLGKKPSFFWFLHFLDLQDALAGACGQGWTKDRKRS